MTKATRLKAEQQFAASQKRDKQVMEEKEKARKERAENVARLRALRLGKDSPAPAPAPAPATAEPPAGDEDAAPTRSPITDSSQFPQARRG